VNGSDKHLIQNTFTQNFAPGYSFTSNSDLDQTTKNFANHFNVNFRNKLDSTQSILQMAQDHSQERKAMAALLLKTIPPIHSRIRFQATL
jgi:hypothetical protein